MPAARPDPALAARRARNASGRPGTDPAKVDVVVTEVGPAGAAARASARRRYQGAVWTARFALLALALGLWQGLTGAQLEWRLLVGQPSTVAAQLGHWAASGSFWADFGWTLEESVLGYLLGTVAAIALVALVVPVPLLARFIAPFVAIANALPKVVLAPVFILWLGFSISAKVYFVAAGIFFIVFYPVYAGLASLDRIYPDNLRLQGARLPQLVRHVYLPAMTGWLISSLRLAAAWSLTSAVLSEYLGSNKGIGYRIVQAQAALNPSAVIAGIIAVAIAAVAVDRALVHVERRFNQWRIA